METLNRPVLDAFIALLERVDAEALPFNLDGWAGHVPTDEFPLSPNFRADPATTFGRPELTCGTTACACGYAALDPRFQARGFQLCLIGDGDKRIVTTMGDLDKALHGNRFLHVGIEHIGPNGTVALSFDAAAQLLRVPYEISAFLFFMGNYGGKSGPLEVAARLRWVRDYLARHGTGGLKEAADAAHRAATEPGWEVVPA